MPMMFERDPEEVGPEDPEDLELRMDVIDSMHTFSPGSDGRCGAYLVRHGARGAICGTTYRYSLFHHREADDPRADFAEGGSHWHDGGDCMCFEGLT